MKATQICEMIFRPKGFAMLLCVFVVALYPDVVFGQRTFFYRDFGLFGYPLAHYHRECFWNGEIPLWNPYNNCGLPFLAQWNTLTLYPLSLIYLLLPLPWSLGIFSLSHLVLAGVAMYFLARELTGDLSAASAAGMAYAFSGLSLHSLMWPNNIAAIAWAPFVVLWMLKASNGRVLQFVIAALVGACQMLTGAPEIILFTWVISIALVSVIELGKGRTIFQIACQFSAVVLVTVALTSPQIFSFAELLRLSHRTPDFAGNQWNLPVWGLANFVVPLFHTSKSMMGVYSQNEQQWTSSYYAGIIVLMLATLSLFRARNRILVTLALLSIVGIAFSFGNNAPFYRMAKLLVPALGVARFPIKFVVIPLFCLPLMAAFAIKSISSSDPTTSNVLRKQLFAVGNLLGLIAICVVAFAHFNPSQNENWVTTLQSGMGRLVILILGITALRKFNTPPGGGVVTWAPVAIVILIGLDGVTQASRQVPTARNEVFALLPEEKSSTSRSQFSRAMISKEARSFFDYAVTANADEYYLTLRRALLNDCNLIDRVPKVDGFFSLYLQEESEVRKLLYSSANFPTALADFLCVDRVTSPTNFFGWMKRTNSLPLITGGQLPLFADANTRLSILGSAQFEPAQTVLLDPTNRITLANITSRGNVAVTNFFFSAQQLRFDATADKPSLIVVAQAYHPNWRVEIDGTPTELFKANHAFQAFRINSGKHSVVLKFGDRRFREECVLTLAAIIALGAVLVRSRRL